jgi:hypothetical protein
MPSDQELSAILTVGRSLAFHIRTHENGPFWYSVGSDLNRVRNGYQNPCTESKYLLTAPTPFLVLSPDG